MISAKRCHVSLFPCMLFGLRRVCSTVVKKLHLKRKQQTVVRIVDCTESFRSLFRALWWAFPTHEPWRIRTFFWCRDQDQQLDKAIILRSVLFWGRIGRPEDIYRATDSLLWGSSTSGELTLLTIAWITSSFTRCTAHRPLQSHATSCNCCSQKQ